MELYYCLLIFLSPENLKVAESVFYRSKWLAREKNVVGGFVAFSHSSSCL